MQITIDQETAEIALAALRALPLTLRDLRTAGAQVKLESALAKGTDDEG